MALIKINGEEIPTPSDYQVGIMDINKAERNAAGTMIMERIATKRKLELQWSYLSKSDLAELLSLVSSVFFTVTYPDPVTNASRTGTFYVGDRTAGMLDFVNGTPRYKDVQFNLIER